MSLKDFMAATPPPSRRRSPLWQYADDIHTLKQKGYTGAQIIEYLRQQGIEIGESRLCQFIRGELGITTNTMAADITIPKPQVSTPAKTDQHQVTPFVPKPVPRKPSAEVTPEQMADFLALTKLGKTKP